MNRKREEKADSEQCLEICRVLLDTCLCATTKIFFFIFAKREFLAICRKEFEDFKGHAGILQPSMLSVVV